MKETVASITKKFETWRFAAKALIYTLQYPTRRLLLSVDASNAQGRINGMTIVELLTIVNLTAGTHERVYLTAKDKTLNVWSEQEAPETPESLR